MSDRAYAKVQVQQKTLTESSPKSTFLQRTCACGQHTIAGGECSTCRNERPTLLRSQRALGSSSSLATAQNNSSPQENVSLLNSVVDSASHFGHDFSQIPVYSSRPPVLQSKLMVNQPGDVYEQEADQVAEQVMRMTEPQLQRTCACGGKSEEGECEACKLSRKAHGEVAGGAHVPGIVHEVLRSPGRPLDEATRTSMDARFHFDFSRVRIHDDAHAAESASAVSALAYTVGRDVVFRAGQYSPATAAGRRLLAHELTHVVQQHASGSTAAQPFTIGPAHGPAEREADAIAEAMAASEPLAPISGTSGTRLQRSAISDDERFLHLGTCMEMACCDAFACQDDKGGIACPDDLECPGDSKNKPFSVFKHKFSRHLSCDPECDKGIVSCSDKDKVLALPKTGDHKFERKKCNQTLTICANGKSTTATVREASETEKSWEASPGVIDALGVGEENFHASVYPKPNDPDMKDDPKCTPKSKPKPKPSKAKPE